MNNPTERFSTRVENYVKYRPDYPPAVVEHLAQECGLTSDSLVADVGSGTGKLSELFLKNGNRVIGIEPNREMREAGERQLAAYERFQSVDGTAEETRLPDESVDFVTAGQAFHWFDHAAARREFARILRPGGWAVLVWNDRRTDTTPFLVAYEHLLREYGTDYAEVSHRQVSQQSIETFFGQGRVRLATFQNRQLFDAEALRGRLLSSSYTPEASDARYEPMLRELEKIFDEHQSDGRVDFEYDTLVYYGHVEKT